MTTQAAKSTDERRAIIDSYRSGNPSAAIAESHGISRQAVEQIVAADVPADQIEDLRSQRRAGQKDHKDNEMLRVVNGQADRIRELVATGDSLDHIAKVTGLSRRVVDRYCKHEGIDVADRVIRRSIAPTFDDDDLFRALNEAAQATVGPLTRADYKAWSDRQRTPGQRQWPPSLHTIDSRLGATFGSWVNTCEAAGVVGDATPTRWRTRRGTSVDDAHAAVVSFVEDCRRSGDAPTRSLYDEQKRSPRSLTVRRTLQADTWADVISLVS